MGKNKPAILPAEMEVIKQGGAVPSTFKSADLILAGLTGKDVDPDKLERLLEIKGRFEAEENKKEFQRRFADLQSELPVIEKTKVVKTKSGQVAYKYAPLEKIVEQIKPVLKKYGFSFRWSEGIAPDNKCKRIICHIMAAGHEEINYCDIPIPAGNQLINASQLAGQATTYGKRYSLIGALGVMADEDTDCTTPQPAAPSPTKQTTPGQALDDVNAKMAAISEYTHLYRELAKHKRPSDRTREFLAQIEFKEVRTIQAEIKKFAAYLKKIKGENHE